MSIKKLTISDFFLTMCYIICIQDNMRGMAYENFIPKNQNVKNQYGT